MSSSGLKVYYDLMSQPCRALYIFLQMTKIPYEEKLVALRKEDQEAGSVIKRVAPNFIKARLWRKRVWAFTKHTLKKLGEHLGDEYGKVNPFHVVPAIDDNGFKLPESVAILKYLADKYNVADHWYPKDLQRRALVDCYMAWQHYNLRFPGGYYFQTKIIQPRRNGTPIDEVLLKKCETELDIGLDKLELIYLKSGTGFLCGSDISLADLLAIGEIMQPLAGGKDVFKDRPRLLAWAKRVKQRIGPELFDKANVMVYKVGEVFAKDIPPTSKL